MSDAPYILLSIFGGASALAVAIGCAVRWAGGESRQPRLPEDPTQRSLAILQERYARGEIDRDEYLERRGYLMLEAERLRELPA